MRKYTCDKYNKKKGICLSDEDKKNMMNRFKYDFSYSIYLYHMIVINVLTIVGINENVQSLVFTYIFTMLFSCLSVFVIEKKGTKLCKAIFRI